MTYPKNGSSSKSPINEPNMLFSFDLLYKNPFLRHTKKINFYQKKKNGVLTTNNKLHTLQNQLFGTTQNLQKYLIIKPVLTLFKTVCWVSAYRKEYYIKIFYFFFAFVCELEIFPLCCCVRQESFSSHQYTLNDGFVSLIVIGAISIDSLTSTTRWHCYLTGQEHTRIFKNIRFNGGNFWNDFIGMSNKYFKANLLCWFQPISDEK